MHVTVCQPDIVWCDKPANHAWVEQTLRAERDAGRLPVGALAVLPEMFATGFCMNPEAIQDGIDEHSPIAETDGNPSSTRFVQSLAQALEINLLAGIAYRSIDAGDEPPGHNKAVLAKPDGSLHSYSKMHPISLSEEHLHFAAGREVVTWRVGEAQVAPTICYDLRFPELYRAATQGQLGGDAQAGIAEQAGQPGAEVLINIANFPASRVDHWVTLLRARAIENQAYVVGCNRTGHDPNLAYPGRSMVIDPRGEIIVDAGDAVGVIHAELDLASLREGRRKFPALIDMQRRRERFGMEL